ncbi:MAG: STAS domain-containing protein [Sulfurospirillaceae bacterium]|nr:STAS domain-containing protein [Sulfurospirillaceae bacterium]
MVSIALNDNVLHIKPEGELSIYQVESILLQLVPLVSKANVCVVNLSSIDKIDTAGFQLLVSLRKGFEMMQKPFEITGIANSTHNFMQLFGFDWDTQMKGEE